MDKFRHKGSNLNQKMQDDLLKLGTISNEYGPQNSEEAIEATKAALNNLLFGLTRNLSAESEEGQFNLASLLEKPADFFGSGEYSGELINLQNLKPETIVIMMKALLMQLNAIDYD